MNPALDALVIGAGQAGLATGYWLQQTSLTFDIVDGASRVGDSWRRRWDSLVLFTPRAYSSLPGLPLGEDGAAYPHKDAVADYLERYADRFRLPVRLGDPVVRLARHGACFQARLASGAVMWARTVIAATGPFQTPAVAAMAQHLNRHVRQLDAGSYRNPRMTPPGTVLVVGDGASGRQIALDLVTTHRVLLATGRPRRVIPASIMGRSAFWWLERLGLLRAPADSPIGARMRTLDPFPGRHLSLRALARAGVAIMDRLDGLDHRDATFHGGRRERINTVIWCSGYRDDAAWLAVDGALDRSGSFSHHAGVSPVPGLYCVGRSWQRTRASALLLGVGDDARHVVARLCADLQSAPRFIGPSTDSAKALSPRRRLQ